jgi:proton glutamate symport protein
MGMSKLPLAAVGVLTAALFLAVLDFYGFVAISSSVLLVSRWLAIAALVAYALGRRSLTTWILVSMVIGAEIGHDFPEVAVALRVLARSSSA